MIITRKPELLEIKPNWVTACNKCLRSDITSDHCTLYLSRWTNVILPALLKKGADQNAVQK